MDSEQSIQNRITSRFPSNSWPFFVRRFQKSATTAYRVILQLFVFLVINLVPLIVRRHIVVLDSLYSLGGLWSWWFRVKNRERAANSLSSRPNVTQDHVGRGCTRFGISFAVRPDSHQIIIHCRELIAALHRTSTTNLGQWPRTGYRIGTTMAELRKVSLDDAQHLIQAGDVPVLRIKLEEDVEKWKTTQSYQDYGIFLRRLSDSVVNHQLPWSPTEPTEVCNTPPFTVQ
jgi:hypothetical protein